MKRISSIIAGSIFAILLMGAVSGTKLQAQNGSGPTFTVPFAFAANGHAMPAGKYRIVVDSNQFTMSIRNLKTGSVDLISVHPGEANAFATHGRLVFRRCGDRNDLLEFHTPGTDEYSQTIPPRQNRESRTCRSADTVTVAAR